MINLSFRVPVGAPALFDLIPIACPDLKEEVYPELLLRSRVRIHGEVETDGELLAEAGTLVEILGDDSDLLPLSTQAPEIIEEGDSWIVIYKPSGPIAASLGLPSEILETWAKKLGYTEGRIQPLHSVDPDVPGLWLLAKSRRDAEGLKATLKSNPVTVTLRAITPMLPSGGFFLRDGGLDARIDVIESRGDLTEIEIRMDRGRILDMRRALSDLGCSIVGDLRFGGVALEGGLHLQVTGIECGLWDGVKTLTLPEQFWPTSVTPFPPKLVPTCPTVMVSDSTIRALDKGHRWILPDAELGDIGPYRPGTLVRLLGRGGGHGPAALIEGPGPISARVWGRRAHMEDLKARFGKAMGRRKNLLDNDETTVYRVIHGEGDGFPGLEVDRYGSMLRLRILGRAVDGFLPEVEKYLRQRFSGLTHVKLNNIRGMKSKQGEVIFRGKGGAKPGEPVLVKELGLTYRVDPWQGLATGFFSDQRENRRRIADRVKKGSRWLNLFSHTGAFTAILLARGAEVVSVDLSSSYLKWLEENLALNGLQDKNFTNIKRDVRAFLLEDNTQFDGIICDPPSAAAAGRKFWSVKKAYPELLSMIVPKVKMGGILLACRNHRHRKPPLYDILHKAGKRAGGQIHRLGDASAGDDYPSIRGFLEGDPFEAALVKRSEGNYDPLGYKVRRKGK